MVRFEKNPVWGDRDMTSRAAPFNPPTGGKQNIVEDASAIKPYLLQNADKPKKDRAVFY